MDLRVFNTFLVHDHNTRTAIAQNTYRFWREATVLAKPVVQRGRPWSIRPTRAETVPCALGRSTRHDGMQIA